MTSYMRMELQNNHVICTDGEHWERIDFGSRNDEVSTWPHFCDHPLAPMIAAAPFINMMIIENNNYNNSFS